VIDFKNARWKPEISHSMLLLTKMLEGFTKNIQLNDPRFLGHHTFYPTLRYGVISAPFIHNPAFILLHIKLATRFKATTFSTVFVIKHAFFHHRNCLIVCSRVKYMIRKKYFENKSFKLLLKILNSYNR
jgi:hypothetical protein